MGSFSSKPKVIVVPGVTARIHKNPIYDNGEDDMETIENFPITSREFHDVLAKCHLDLSMFFENAEKKTFTIDPSPGDRGIMFQNHTEKHNFTLVFHRGLFTNTLNQEPATEKMTKGDFGVHNDSEAVKHPKTSSTPNKMNGDSDLWSVSTLVEEKEPHKELPTQSTVDMAHRYDPKTKTLTLDHRYTCNVNTSDGSRKWIMNGIEQSELAGTVPAKKFMKFGDVYGLKRKSTIQRNTQLVEKREARELVGCSPIFL